MNGDLLRIVEVLHREKDIDKEVIFQGIEAAVASATKKHYGRDAEIRVVVDRETGALTAYEEDRLIDPEELGRIAAQSAKQMMIQKIREAELEDAIRDLERFNAITLGREDRIIGLKAEVNTLLEQMKRKKRYGSEKNPSPNQSQDG